MDIEITYYFKSHLSYMATLSEAALSKELDQYESLFDHMFVYFQTLGLSEANAKEIIAKFRSL